MLSNVTKVDQATRRVASQRGSFAFLSILQWINSSTDSRRKQSQSGPYCLIMFHIMTTLFLRPNPNTPLSKGNVCKKSWISHEHNLYLFFMTSSMPTQRTFDFIHHGHIFQNINVLLADSVNASQSMCFKLCTHVLFIDHKSLYWVRMCMETQKPFFIEIQSELEYERTYRLNVKCWST